jgi:uncharacterized membrane protein
LAEPARQPYDDAAMPTAPAGVPERPAAPLFDAVLTPHRSLGPLGFRLLIGAVAAVSFAVGLAFALQGAWPVSGFFGLDVVLVYWAFRANYRSGRLYETVRMTRDRLDVRRVAPRGAVRRWSFQPYWLRVDLRDAADHHSRLVLS